MSATCIIIVGAGGHARVLADALLAGGMNVLGYVDSDPRLAGSTLLGLPMLGDDAWLANQDRRARWLVNGIGGVGAEAGVSKRQSVQLLWEAAGWQFAGVQHPSAVVSRFATVESDAQLLAGCVVQCQAQIGKAAIINTRAVVEHDAQVGAFSHIAPGAVICGDVRIGEGCHIGAAAVVRQGLAIEAGVRVGAGAAVVRAYPAGVLAGVPARPLEARR